MNEKHYKNIKTFENSENILEGTKASNFFTKTLKIFKKITKTLKLFHENIKSIKKIHRNIENIGKQ